MTLTLTVIGLILNTTASILVIIPYLSSHNVDDDFIVNLNRKTGNFRQKKHIKEKRFAVVGFLLFAAGFILQIVGILIGT